jgi:hypothetical protein
VLDKIERLNGWKRIWFVSNFVVFFYYYFFWYVESSLIPDFLIHTSDFISDLILRPIFNSLFDFPPIRDVDEIPFFQQQMMNLRSGLSFLVTYVFYSMIFYKTGKWIYKGFKNK